MGVATYKTSKQTPVQMKGILRDTDELVNCCIKHLINES